MKEEINFTALFVKDRLELLKRFPPKHENVFADHFYRVRSCLTL